MTATAFSIVDTAPAKPPALRTSMRIVVPLPSAALSFDLVSTRAGFDELEHDWNELFERAGRSTQMFMTFNWLWHWANHYLDANDELAIVTARRNGRLVMIWPLMVERVARLEHLAFMGAPVSQYGDVLIDDLPDQAGVLDAAWSFLRTRRSFDVVRLAKVRDDAVVAPLLAALGFVTTSREEAPYASLAEAGTFAQFETRSPAKQRKNRRRQLRRLEERGPLEMRWMTSGDAARDAVRLTMTLKRAWLNGKGLISAAFKDERIDQFFMDAVSSTQRPCGVSISQLNSNGEGADSNISITCKGRRAVHIIAYGMKFDKLGVGNHHLDLNIERAFQDQVAVYDFLAPRHDYKMELADGVIGVSDYTLAISPLGRLYVDLYVARLREVMKRVLGALPAGLRRVIAGAHQTVRA